ncbi:hypothetical protein [Thermocatellispora tengchongensis]|uniref:hypothetical protein n=1 Tax=Thermocatellispora tengchongensis TaxID=1073253 RepID=UPI00363B3E86
MIGGDRRATEVDNQLVLMTAPKGGTVSPVPLGDIEGLTRVARETARVAAAGGRYVAVGAAVGDAGLWTSFDGQGWAAAEPAEVLGGPREQALRDVAYGRKGWIAVGRTMRDGSTTEPLLITSPDGSRWSRIDPGGALAPAEGHYFLAPHAVAAGRDGYVLAGEDRDQNGAVPALWFSTDLKRFTRSQKLPAGGAGVRLHDVAATAEGYVAVGGSGATGHETGVVWVSPDGVNWTARKRVSPPGATSAGLRHVAAMDGTIVAIGTATTGDEGPTRVFAAVSGDDGASWEYAWLPAEQAAAVQDVAATGDGLVAVGWHGPSDQSDSAAWTSENGLDWQRRTLDQPTLSGVGAQWLGSVAVSGDNVVAIGRSTSYSADHLTLWRTTLSR